MGNSISEVKTFDVSTTFHSAYIITQGVYTIEVWLAIFGVCTKVPAQLSPGQRIVRGAKTQSSAYIWNFAAGRK